MIYPSQVYTSTCVCRSPAGEDGRDRCGSFLECPRLGQQTLPDATVRLPRMRRSLDACHRLCRLCLRHRQLRGDEQSLACGVDSQEQRTRFQETGCPGFYFVGFHRRILLEAIAKHWVYRGHRWRSADFQRADVALIRRTRVAALIERDARAVGRWYCVDRRTAGGRQHGER